MKRLMTLITLACLLVTTAAEAYVVIRTQTGAILRWDKSTIDWTIQNGGMVGISNSDFQEALAAAFQSWEDVECSTIGFDYEGYKSWDSGNGIHVYVQTNSWDPSVGDALAFALPDANWQGKVDSVDIVFNAVDAQWSVSPNPGYGYTDVQGVVSHEIGHALGLDHPRDPESTMFFSGGSTKLRTLEDDDERGACFLYPATYFDDGIACDACEESDNCASGYCLGWGGNEAFCGESCSSDSQCPDGFHCQEINNDIPDQCIPDNGYCHDAGGNIANGDFCFGHQTCEGGVCLVLPDEVYCSQQCTVSCPSGMTCINGVCLKAGNKAYGALCDKSSECQTGTCVNFTNYGTCTQYCGKNGGTCPNGNQCFFDAVCVPPGTGLNGQPCYTPIQCQGTYCIDGACTQPCTSNAGCPSGTTCTAGYCEGVLAGGQCSGQNDCADGLTCQKDTNSGPGYCYRACEPLADTGCLPDEVCQWRYEGWAQYITGRCVPKNYGAAEGEACSASVPCEANYICALGKGSVETCHRDCKLFANNLGCTLGQTCETLGLSDDPKHGICTSETSGPTNPDPDPPPPTPDTSTPPTPDTSTPTPDAGPGPTPDATPPRMDTGTTGTPGIDSGTTAPIGGVAGDLCASNGDCAPGTVCRNGACSPSCATLQTPCTEDQVCDESGAVALCTAPPQVDSGGCQTTAPSPLWWLGFGAALWLTRRRRLQL